MSKSLNVRLIAGWVGEKALGGIIENSAWWGFVSVVILAVGGSGFLAYWFRLALLDFFQADLRVWHLILVLVSTALAAYVWRQRWQRAGRAEERQPGTAFKERRYIRYKGVDWNVYGGAPRCPKDHTYLAWRLKDDSQPMPFTSDEDLHLWKALPDGRLNFMCLKCHANYDLNGDGSMTYLQSVVRTLSEADD